MIHAAGMAQANQAMHHNRRRMDAQVDAALKSKCGDHYKAPSEDDMGHTFLNSPIIGDDALNKLTAALNATANANANASGQQPTTPQQPIVPQPTIAKRGIGSLVLSGLGKMLPLLAVAGVSIAAARYFAPADKNNAYEIEAIPYQPAPAPAEPNDGSQPTSTRDLRDRPWS